MLKKNVSIRLLLLIAANIWLFFLAFISLMGQLDHQSSILSSKLTESILSYYFQPLSSLDKLLNLHNILADNTMISCFIVNIVLNFIITSLILEVVMMRLVRFKYKTKQSI